MKSPPPSEEDVTWFGSLTHKELSKYVTQRTNIRFHNLPVQSTVGVDARAYHANLNLVRGFHPSLLHLITISTASPTAPIAIFIFPSSAKEHYEVSYIHDTVTLSLKKSEETVHWPTPGTRGVATLSAPAELKWKLLNEFITIKTLSLARIKPDEAITSPLPAFEPLPTARRPRRTGPRLTEYHLDRSEFVKKIVEDRHGGKPSELLGELQLSFICFAIVGDPDALEHWARLVREVSRCKEIVRLFDNMPEFADHVARILQAQLSMVNGETVVEALSCEIRQYLACFVSAAWERSTVQEFTRYVNEIMGWKLTGNEEEGDDEDGPVVVDIDGK